MKKLLMVLILTNAIIFFAAADTLWLETEDGKYLGNLSTDPYDINSTGNPYSRYGSQYSPDSINNPYGKYGSEYSPDSVNNSYATNPPQIKTRK